MKFVCEKNAILTEIAIAQEIIIAKNPISILANIYLETADNALIIKSSDIKINFTTKVPVSVAETGKITVRGDKFLEILSAMPEGEVEFQMFENKLILKPAQKKATFKVPTIPIDQYPEFPKTDDVHFFDLKIKEFKSMINQTIFSVSDDETRFFMTGIYFEKIEDKLIMVSTDGRRLACIEQDVTDSNIDFKSIIIPEKILSILLKRSGDEGSVSIGITENHIFINFASYNLSSVLIEGQFPNYKKVIPTDNIYKIILNKKELVEAIKRVSIMVEKKTKKLFFQFRKDYVSIYTGDNELGDATEEIPCEFNEDDKTLALNYSYIEDVCKVMNEEKICIMFKDPGKAITFKPEPEENYLHVIMPMS